jgi:hypothetical protein
MADGVLGEVFDSLGMGLSPLHIHQVHIESQGKHCVLHSVLVVEVQHLGRAGDLLREFTLHLLLEELGLHLQKPEKVKTLSHEVKFKRKSVLLKSSKG